MEAAVLLEPDRVSQVGSGNRIYVHVPGHRRVVIARRRQTSEWA
jgi:hypothetical protein